MTVTGVENQGQSFYANGEELGALFGHKIVNGHKLEVIKEAWTFGLNQKSWTIKVWKTIGGSHGRREPAIIANARDWNVGDTIMSKACNGGNYLMSIL